MTTVASSDLHQNNTAGPVCCKPSVAFTVSERERETSALIQKLQQCVRPLPQAHDDWQAGRPLRLHTLKNHNVNMPPCLLRSGGGENLQFIVTGLVCTWEACGAPEQTHSVTLLPYCFQSVLEKLLLKTVVYRLLRIFHITLSQSRGLLEIMITAAPQPEKILSYLLATHTHTPLLRLPHGEQETLGNIVYLHGVHMDTASAERGPHTEPQHSVGSMRLHSSTAVKGPISGNSSLLDWGCSGFVMWRTRGVTS